MRSLSSLGLGLSVVFVCLLLALIAEIYYLLWWKRRVIRREIDNGYTSPARDFFLYMICWKKKPSPSSSSLVNYTNAPQSYLYPEFQFHSQNLNNEGYLVKPYDENGVLEPGLITGPPRFLFTIKEETKEDMESEDGKSRELKRSSLSELLKNIETPPYLTPLSSPPFVTPPVTPIGSCHSSQSGSVCNYNPFYESSSDAEFSRMVKASPPPKFKFLRDAEEKLRRKTMLIEEAKKKEANLAKCGNGEEECQDGSFITVIVANSNKNRQSDEPNHYYHSPQGSSSSQVLPLPSSPSTLAPSFTRHS